MQGPNWSLDTMHKADWTLTCKRKCQSYLCTIIRLILDAFIYPQSQILVFMTLRFSLLVLFIKELARLKFVARLFIQGKASFDNFFEVTWNLSVLLVKLYWWGFMASFSPLSVTSRQFIVYISMWFKNDYSSHCNILFY